MAEKTDAEKLLDEQLELALQEYKCGAMSAHEFFRWFEMIYKDFLDFHPEERNRIMRGQDE